MSFGDAPAPSAALSPLDMLRAADPPPGLGDYLGANLAEGFWQTALGQVGAGIRLNRAEVESTFLADESRPLTRDEWQASEFHRDRLPYRADMTRATARALAEIHDENAARRRLIDRRDAGIGEMALGFGAAVLGALPTPENFIPFAGPALYAARAGRLGAHMARLGETAEAARTGALGARAAFGAGAGALDATAGNLLAMPSVQGSRQAFGDDITWADVVQDLALGAAGGAVLGAGLSAAIGRQAGRLDAPPATPLPASTQDAALRNLTAAASQLADGDEINLAQASPAMRQEVETLRAEARRLRAMMQPEADASLSGRAAARPLEASGRAAPGVETRASTPAGTDVRLRYEVVEAESLTASHSLPDFGENPAFAAELQPRDRSTAERQAQVRNIAARLRPEELEASPLTTTGAPIIGPDNLVESGNGRVLAIATAYREGLPTAQSYRAMLTRAGFADAAEMREPVLIRRRVSELDSPARRRFVNESNLDTIDALTPGEQARVDAQAIRPEILALLRARDLAAAANADFHRAFIAALPGRDQRALSREGALTPDGITRLRRALAARAYDDPQLIARLTETADETIGRGLMDAAPAIADMRAAREAGQVRPELDAIDALVRAVRRIQSVRDANLPLRAALDQLDLFGGHADTAERAFLELLLRHPNRDTLGGVGREAIADRLESYARHARAAPTEPDMFGTMPPGLGEVLGAAFRDARLDAPAGLRDLRLDSYAPPPPDVPEPPPPAPARTETDPVAKAAEARGLDAETASLSEELARLRAEGRLPDDIAGEIATIEALAAKTERAPETWDAAATCALGG